MSKLLLPILLLVLVTAHSTSAAPGSSPSVIKTITVTGFDPDGEPEIRVMSNGSLLIVFSLMPPSYVDPDSGVFKDFDNELERAIGVPVLWEDREVFLIRKPRPDTAQKVKNFLEGCRKKKGP